MQTKTNDNPLKLAPIALLGLSVASNAIQGHRARKQKFEAENPGEQYKFDPKAAFGDAIIGANNYSTSSNGNLQAGLMPGAPMPNANFSSADYAKNYEKNLTNDFMNPFAKEGKVLKPITSYYGEAKNLSSLAYKDSILMKTVSGVNTLGNKEDRIIVGKDYKRGSYVPEYILEDMIRQQTGDEPKDSVQDYTKVKGFGKNKYVKPLKNK